VIGPEPGLGPGHQGWSRVTGFAGVGVENLAELALGMNPLEPTEGNGVYDNGFPGAVSVLLQLGQSQRVGTSRPPERLSTVQEFFSRRRHCGEGAWPGGYRKPCSC
jgi:hypothetical protein